MAEYLIQDTTLTGIADKIRPLLGLTGTMTPEQMQTNLTTEQANITAALAALAEKGVEVPEGANSNALAGLIAAIESGGGLAFNPFHTRSDAYVIGTITPAEDITTSYTLTHCFSGEKFSLSMAYLILICGFGETITNRLLCLINIPEAYNVTNRRTTMTGYSGGAGGFYTDGDKSTVKFEENSETGEVSFVISLNRYSQLNAGDTYTWMIGKGELA